MLPRFPRIQEQLDRFLLSFISLRAKYHMGPMGQVPEVRHFEGDEDSIVRASGEEELTRFTEIKEALTIDRQALSSITLEDILEKLDRVALGIARQTATSLYKTLSEACEKHGTAVDGGGRPLSADSILEVFCRIEIQFKADGSPILPQLHIHPSMEEAVIRAMKQIEENSEYKRRMDEILVRQREDWRAREAARRLVG